MKNDIRIRKIWQKNNHEFSIEWNDGCVVDYCLSELQKNCPCAGCIDKASGNRLVNENPVKSDVRAIRIFSVGRYALRILFTSGCSNGIFDFNFLRNFSHAR